MLNVTISGPAKSGKTTLAVAIATFLHDQGFQDVTVDDDDTVMQLCINYEAMEQIARKGVQVRTCTTTKDAKSVEATTPHDNTMGIVKPRGTCLHTHTFSSPLPDAVWFSDGMPRGKHESLVLKGCYLCGQVSVKDTNA